MTLFNHPHHQRAGLGPIRAVVLLAGAMFLMGSPVPAQRLPKDPVEKFRQALLVEYSKRVSYKNSLTKDSLTKALAFRKKNLEEASDDLESLSEISRALLLIDWPQSPKSKLDDDPSEFDKLSREIESKIREAMAKKFNDGVKAILENPRAKATTRVAVTNLLGETVAQAAEQSDERLVLYKDLAPLAKVLSKQISTSEDRVRVAIARALGQFPNEPSVVAPALRRLLAAKYEEATRRAAADALYNLALSVSNGQPIRGSEPGVSNREGRRNRRLFSLKETADIVTQVTDAAVAGLSDTAIPVRRQCMSAIHHAASGLAFDIRVIIPSTSAETNYPPRERADLSAEENRRLRLAREDMKEDLSTLEPALNHYRKFTAALGKAVRDTDPEVRFEARRALEELARARGALRELKESIPDPSKPDDKTDKDVSRRSLLHKKSARATPQGTIRLTSGTSVIAAPPSSTDPPVTRIPGQPRLIQAPDAKSDPISDLLMEIGGGLVRDGLRDPDPKARRAAHEAIEALGDTAIVFIPALVKSLADSDVFVRWITARTLRKIAENDDRFHRTSKNTDTVIPALIKGLEDEDLDGRIAMTRAIGAYGPAAKEAVPALADRLIKGDAEYRIVVIKALEGIGEDSKAALPTVAKALADPDARIRAESARLIGRLAKYASSYVADLEKLTNDPDGKVRESASAALLIIEAK